MSLPEVLPSAAAALGVRGFQDTVGFGHARHAVILLVDGLGWKLLRAYAEHAPTLASLSGGAMDTVFPSTTATALGSLGTGLPPGSHGLVGGTFWLPDADLVLNPLRWSAEASPYAVQPEPTVFERVASAGVDVSLVGNPDYASSGLTKAVLRGGRYIGADLAESAAAAVTEASAGDRSLTYAYWAELDRVGHEFGAGSAQWIRALVRVDAIIAEVASALPRDGVAFVTADHGMVNCPVTSQILIQEHRDLMAGVRLVTGEPRVRHLFVEDPDDRVAERWTQHLGDRATVLTRAELLDRRLLGAMVDGIEERIGDVIVVATGDVSLASTTDRRVSSLLGQHGALTTQEREIPALWIR